MLVDFENLYYFIRQQPNYRNLDAMQIIVELLQQLRQFLESEYQESTISLDAYADFERIDVEAQGALYLLGFTTHNVLGTDHKNAADMKLCIDAMETLHTRPEIRTFVLIAGDRDYIPLLQHLKRKARVVRVVGFPGSTSGDLLTTLGQQFFIDGQQFLPRPSLPAAPLPPPVAPPVSEPTVSGPAVPAAPGPIGSEFEYEKIAIQVVFKYFKNKPEIWMSPYLHKLRAEIPELSESDRKAIISRLRDNAAITIETREGDPNPYTIFTLNWNHPLVQMFQ